MNTAAEVEDKPARSKQELMNTATNVHDKPGVDAHDKPAVFSKLELESVKSLTAVVELTSLSFDTLARNYPQYIITLSARRKGMKLRHVLGIMNGTLKPKTAA